MHDFVGEPRRGEEPTEGFDPARRVAGLLLELASSSGGRLLARLELAGAELDEPEPDRDPAVAHEHQPAVGQHGDDRDRPRMAHDLPLSHRAVRAVDGEPLDAEHRADMQDRPRGTIDLRIRHGGWHDTQMEHAPAATTTSDDMPIVRVEKLEKRFGRLHVLRGITLAFPPGKTTVVLGPSGCGKSVLLKHLVGLLKPDKGSIHYGDTRIDTLGERGLADLRRQFGFLFQHGALFDSMTIAENVAFPLREKEGRPPFDEEARVRRVLDLVGLADKYDRYPAELSGGQQKRIALARAVILRPKVMLYDEPTTGLDPIRSDVINELIIKLKQRFHFTSIVVTHDLASAFKVADHMVMFHEGQVYMEGHPDDFRNSTDPLVARFLKGEASEEELRAIRRLDATGSTFGAPR